MLIDILLLEDDPADRLLIERALKLAGANRFQVDWADRLCSGLEKLSAHKPDAIILDLSLLDSQGLETFARVHAQAPDVPVVVLTGLEDEELAVQAVRTGAQDYLVKSAAGGGSAGVRPALRDRTASSRARPRALSRHSGTSRMPSSSTTIDGNILTWNAAAERMYGYTAEEIKGKHFSILVVEDRRSNLAANRERLAGGEGIRDVETYMCGRTDRDFRYHRPSLASRRS